jgi:hypothetical protein
LTQLEYPNRDIGIMEYWNDVVRRRKKSVASDFDTHYSTISTIYHCNSAIDYAQGQGFSPGIEETRPNP